MGASRRAQLPVVSGGDGGGAASRRALLQLLGASIALSGAAGCLPQPLEKILPAARKPSALAPGTVRRYATSMCLDGYATGLLVTSYEGRPIKVEGNPDHPASLGATGVHEQASVLGLYDPSRARAIRRRDGGIPTWDAFVSRFGRRRPDGGAGLRIVLDPTTSPLVASWLGRVRARYPGTRFVFMPKAAGVSAREGARLAFGAPSQPMYDLGADVIAALDADPLGSAPSRLVHARRFTERRRPAGGQPMNRLYVVEAAPSVTGTMADHRLRRRSEEIPWVAAQLAAELILGLGLRPPDSSVAARLAALRPEVPDPWIAALARDLSRARGAGLVVVGERQPPEVHVLGHLVNAALGSRSAWGIDPVLLEQPGAEQDLAGLAADIEVGAVDTVLILEANPSYSAAADLEIPRRLRAVRESAYLGLYEDETARDAAWFVPAAHYLESWGDARAEDGTVSFVQPLIEPMHGGRTAAEILAVVAGERNPLDERLLRTLWAEAGPAGSDAATFWNEALRMGFLPGSASPRRQPTFDDEGVSVALERLAARRAAGGQARAPEAGPGPGAPEVELNFVPDARVRDGRFANNAWLQELPDPITKLTWDNAAWLSPATASELGVETGDVLRVERAGLSLELPALIVPGHADGSLTLPLGYGRDGEEALARGVGQNANLVRTSDSPFFAAGAAVTRTGRRHALAVTQEHWKVEGRPIARSLTAAEYASLAAAPPEPEHRPSLYEPDRSWEQGSQWAMAIDMSACTGCSACVVACQAENNILVVGREGVLHGREMHWLRIDAYRFGDPESPEVVHQPMLCQHCEMAPCEYVCPVNATVHSPDGLNEMTYNRCVGTRFCSNNCPYKVRRFNWFDWTAEQPANRGAVALQRNPEVTVRDRGVMEKCTFCVQRIRTTEIRARVEGRPLRQGEIQTACQEACPSRAIVFGSLAHPEDPVTALQADPRSYGVLEDLGTRPRVRYLARLRNPNPEIPA